MKKRMLSIVMALAMILSLLPATALAAVAEVDDSETYFDDTTESFRICEDYWADIVTEAPAGYAADGEAKTVTISSPEGLAWWAKQVNSGTDFAGYTVSITADIDLSGHYWTPIDTATIQFTEKDGKVSWTTVAPQKKLDGVTIDGGGYTITGLATATGIRGPAQPSDPGDGQNCYYYSAFIGRNDGTLTIRDLTFDKASIAISEPADGVSSNGTSMCAVVTAISTGALTLDGVTVSNSKVFAMQKASALLGMPSGGFKKVSFETAYVLKPQVQELSGDPTQAVTGVKAYAFAADTALYTVASYDDALNGVITRRADASEKIATPSATGESYEAEGAEGWLRMTLTHPTQMIVAVDPSRRLYAYTQQEISETLSTLYVSLVFKPWKEGNFYSEGKWQFYNEFYVPPTTLDCFIDPKVELTEGAAPTSIETVKIYAYAVDTTSWYLASYDDAVAGVLTSKSDPEVTRSNPNFQAYLDSESGLYKMEVSAGQLMLVVADRTDRLYAYSQRNIDLTGASPTYPLLFRPWRQVWIEQDQTDDWVIVNPAHAPSDTE